MKHVVKLSLADSAKNIILLIGLILLIFLGLDILFQMEGFDAWFRWTGVWVPVASLEFWPKMILAILCIVLPIFFWATALISRQLSRGIVGKGEGGDDICLTPDAIEQTVVREVRSAVPEVLRVRDCQAVQGRQAASVMINVIVSDRAPVPNVQARIRQTVEDTLVRLIGYADGSQVRVKVSRIASGASKKRKRARKNKAAIESSQE